MPIVADVAIRNVAMTEAQFVQRVADRTPLGYGAWRSFIPGDYEFTVGLVEIEMTRPATGVDPRLGAVVVRTDVPDLDDRGSATLAAAGSTITFNRTFRAVPEVTVQLKAGTTAVRTLTSSPTTTSIFIQAFDAAGTGVTADITWAAKGY